MILICLMSKFLYQLLDIEFWEYAPNVFPVLRKDFDLSDICIVSEKYTVNQMNLIQKNIVQHFQNLGYKCSVMNPLYPDKGFTVMSVDLYRLHDFNFIHKQYVIKLIKSQILDEIIRLMNEHEQRLNYMFKNGNANLSQKINKNGIFIASDVILRDIEMKLIKVLPYALDEVIHHIINHGANRLVFINALRWAYKDNHIKDLLFDILLQSNVADELNLVLLQFIAMVKVGGLSKLHLEKLKKLLLNKTLKFPNSIVRNKTLSILSILDNLKIKDKSTIDFITLISKTKQLNCSCPANEIIKAL